MQRTATPLTSVRFLSQPPLIMKIFITGTSGFIGFHLTKNLLSQGHSVVGIDNHNDFYDIALKKYRCSQNNDNNFQFEEIELNEDLTFLDGQFDVAINLAAQAGVRAPKKYKEFYESTNINGFKNFLNFCSRNAIKNIIYASSSSVYSDDAAGKFNEEQTKLAPKSAYGYSKMINEEMAHEYAKENNAKLIGLRFFSIYGPFGRPDMAYYLFTKKIINGEAIYLHNEGKHKRDMTYIDDCIRGILSTIDYLRNRKSYGNELLNIGNDNPIKTIDLLKKIEKELNLKSIVINKDSKNESNFTHSDNNKAKKKLNYVPKINIDEGLKSFIGWYKNYEKS